MSERELRVFATPESTARNVALCVERSLEDDVADRGEAHLVLTGGTIGIDVLRHVDPRNVLPWGDIHLWWGDERFVENDSPMRNDVAANEALISRIGIPDSNVHRILSSRDCASPEVAASAYEREIMTFFGADFPHFDTVLLGVGPDAHIASLFPHREELRISAHTVIAVHDSPKPPSDRVSLTLPSINASRRVWLIATGSEKRDAISRGLGHPDAINAPASAVSGVDETVFFVDEDAAKNR